MLHGMLSRSLWRKNAVQIVFINRHISSNSSYGMYAHDVSPPAWNFSIIDSTLREGEQFATAEFTTMDRVYIAKTLDRLGVDYIEMVNPMASLQAVRDLENVVKLGLKAKILAHTRCHMADVKRSVNSGVNGVNIYMATSETLRKHSHGLGIDAVIDHAKEVIQYVLSHGLEVRFSCEDTFRSDREDLLRIYAAVDQLGVHRVGLADTVGIARPMQVKETVEAVRGVVSPNTGIEFHTHNDTGMCIANAVVAIEAGATHIDTSVLGLGERNGITPLGGFLGCMYSYNKEAVSSRYRLDSIAHLERYVAQACGVKVPFNNYVTGSCAFTHKAGVHSKAVMLNPDSYEVINPVDFGIERRIEFAHRLTGWNAIQQRSKQLSLDISDDQIKAATVIIKDVADETTISLAEIDAILIKLAQGPRVSSSTFFHVSKDILDTETRSKAELAAKAIHDYELASAVHAVRSVAADVARDERPTLAVEVCGHLFDKAVLNRLFDIIVDSPCDFKVVQLNVGVRNDCTSSAILQLWHHGEHVLQTTASLMEALVKSNAPFAECSISRLSIGELCTSSDNNSNDI